MIVSLQKPGLNNPAINKHVHAVYKAMKHFQAYLLKNQCIIFVPHLAVRSLFVQQELGERRANWMTGLQEYDLEFKPVHIIKGHGLCRLTEEAMNEIEDDPTRWEEEIEMYNVERATPTFISDSWYENVPQYLEHGTFPSHLSVQQKSAVRLKYLSY